jgi:hypothetical protein
VQICYVDEAGDTRDLAAAPPHGNITPVLVIAGLVVDQRLLDNLTRAFVETKARFYPGLVANCATRLERILPEIKGADLRRAVRTGAPRRNRTQTIGFLDALMDLLEYHDAKIFGRVWVKVPGGRCDARAMYTFSVQAICADFQNFLEGTGDSGIVIADSRNPGPNASVAHSIFTQKFKVDGDRYPRVLEMPVFGHSQNHAGIQIADLLCSALLFPMATRRYCTGHVANVHVDAGFAQLTRRYGQRLRAMQHRYVDDLGHSQGGITVSDPVGMQHSGRLYQDL